MKKKVIITVLGVLYVLSPIDLLPDVIPVAGFFDDLGIIGLVIKALLAQRKPA